ncbi:CueP family metal-binding protein [Tessaracoccus sp. OS52]|uniref:CueP family metal-binding protein n=1 Tax=Tessaracoccus sp. OS52 TaxID=2886691 RepID=UPI001D0F70B1|nr:CueP family metal-binding protein [Tessaracoccus sp. OS52]MCC2593120.1 CueP family metal-binding protein [Tessaracoccus sp. OS52]
MKKTLLAIAAVTALLASGCSAPTPATPASSSVPASSAVVQDTDAMLARHGMAGLSPREVVETMDQDPSPRPLPMVASVRYDQVVLADEQGEVTMPLDGEDFYLSIAPYVTFTHDCYFHNLGTCQGELAGETVHVNITTEGGDVLVDEEATLQANGFVGFWLPRDVAGTVTVTYDGKTAVSPFSSDPEGPTCLTTLELK